MACVPGSPRRVRPRSLLLVVVLVATLMPAPDAGAAVPRALTTIRAVHVVPGAPGLDLAVDGQLAASDVRLGQVSPSATIEPGERLIAITPAGGAGVPIVEQRVRIDEGSAYIVTVFGEIGETKARINEVNLDALPPGAARVRLIHVAAGAGDLDLIGTGGEEIFDRIAFEVDTAYAELPAGLHRFEVRGGEDQAERLAALELEMGAGQVYDLIVHAGGERGPAGVVVVPTSASPPCSEITGAGTPSDACLRIVNASGAAEVTVAINDGAVAGPLAIDEVTGFIPVAAREDLQLQIGGVQLEPTELDLVAGQAYIIVLPPGDGDAPVVAEIDLTPLPGSQPRLRLINVAEDFGDTDVRLPAVDDTVLLLSDVGTMSSSRYRILDRGHWQVELMGKDDQRLEPWLTLEPGLVYDVVLRPTPNGFELLVITSPAQIRGAEGTPVVAGPGVTPVPATS